MRVPVCVTVLLMVLAPAGWAKSPEQNLSRPEWGAVLFDAYSNRPLAALTRLLAREKQGVWSGEEKDKAQTLIAALFVDLGMPVAASERMEAIVDTSLKSQQKSRLMMFMARQFYLNQQWDEADRWLARTDTALLEQEEQQRWAFLKGQIAFAKGLYQPAATWFEKTESDGNWALFGQFNRGVALLRDKDQDKREQGEAKLSALLSLTHDDEETAAVQDKALLALGWYDLTQKNQPKSAIAWLLQVRKESPMAKEALLLLGWGLAKEGRYAEALAAWTHLSAWDDPLHPAVQEAWLAAPYAKQKLGDLQGAMDGYRIARERARSGLEKLQQMARDRYWLALWTNEGAVKGAADYSLLQYVVSDGPMLRLLKQWEYLATWQERLDYAKRTIPVLRWTAKARVERFKQHQRVVRKKLGSIPFASLDTQTEALQKRWQQQPSAFCIPERWSPNLASVCERILKAKTLLREIPGELKGDRAQRLSRLEGVFLWKATRQFPEDRWKIEKAMQQLQEARKQLTMRRSRLMTLLAAKQPPMEPVLARLDALERQVGKAEKSFTKVRQNMLMAMDERFGQLFTKYQRSLRAIQSQAQLALARLEYLGAADDPALRKDRP